MNDFIAARELLQGADDVLFLTGAGISRSAGLRTYRGEDGLYPTGDMTALDVSMVTPEGLPELWRHIRAVRPAESVGPTAAHHAISRYAAGRNVTVATQNVDGLHEASAAANGGHEHVLALHGSFATVSCVACGSSFSTQDVNWGARDVPLCAHCSGPCRPDVTLFGEALPRGVLEAASIAAQQAQVMVVVGSSLEVVPAAGLVSLVDPQCPVFFVSPTEPPYGNLIHLEGTADEVVPALLLD